MGETAKPRRVVIALYEDIQLLDAAGPADVLVQADRRAGGGAYEVMFVASQPTVRTSAGLVLNAKPLPSARRTVHTLIVPGARDDAMRAAMADTVLMDWMSRAADTATRVVSICTGAFLLGELGLLDGHRATTHWGWLDRLAEKFPKARVEREALFVEDGRLWTSAGAASGIDLALALVARDLGHDMALLVARGLVLHLVRPGGQSQFAAPLSLQASAGPDLGRLISWLSERRHRETTVAEMATAIGMSERSFYRRCFAAFGMAPAKLLNELRMDHARALLRNNSIPVKTVAARCGFGDATAFSTAFARRFGASPTVYRRAFAIMTDQ
ncbi:helix-turn-helix domain-containing protein [Bradyrhizobium sediminis]|uniref:Helix-turn-helix domain-containing protein n=1 Tax=Bradyrhizobium sediminis TaxID=2840469 RepID=A0A975P0T8_9BRAD|nr:helix-turn-helix domain-containing protein [Bradyrhizobium sediminis]QWG24535.1 helix-turn-helix domain-containing protein [Bradyrhizobium sediminis]